MASLRSSKLKGLLYSSLFDDLKLSLSFLDVLGSFEILQDNLRL